jgi:hypothetical protein
MNNVREESKLQKIFDTAKVYQNKALAAKQLEVMEPPIRVCRLSAPFD